LGEREGNVRRFWRRDDELHRLEAELRANRTEPPKGFIRTLVQPQRGEDRWLRPKVRVGLAVALGGLALAAMASAGGFGVIAHTTKAAVKVMQRTTHRSARQTVFSGPANAQYQKHCGGLNEVPCHITIFDASVKEGDTGTTAIVFTVSLDATPSSPVTVYYTISDNTASSSVDSNCPTPDYQAAGTPPSPLVFPTGVASQTITVQVYGDLCVEPDETFYVTLTASSPNSTIYRSRATGTIVNDDR
jgi:Calx-beta domain